MLTLCPSPTRHMVHVQYTIVEGKKKGREERRIVLENMTRLGADFVVLESIIVSGLKEEGGGCKIIPLA